MRCNIRENTTQAFWPVGRGAILLYIWARCPIGEWARFYRERWETNRLIGGFLRFRLTRVGWNAPSLVGAKIRQCTSQIFGIRYSRILARPYSHTGGGIRLGQVYRLNTGKNMTTNPEYICVALHQPGDMWPGGMPVTCACRLSFRQIKSLTISWLLAYGNDTGTLVVCYIVLLRWLYRYNTIVQQLYATIDDNLYDVILGGGSKIKWIEPDLMGEGGGGIAELVKFTGLIPPQI